MAPGRAERDRSVEEAGDGAGRLPGRRRGSGLRDTWRPADLLDLHGGGGRGAAAAAGHGGGAGAGDHGLPGAGGPDRHDRDRRAPAPRGAHRPRRRGRRRSTSTTPTRPSSSTRAGGACPTWPRRRPPPAASTGPSPASSWACPGERIGPLSDLAADGPASYLATVIIPASGDVEHDSSEAASGTARGEGSRDLLCGGRAGGAGPHHVAGGGAAGEGRRGGVGRFARAGGGARPLPARGGAARLGHHDPRGRARTCTPPTTRRRGSCGCIPAIRPSTARSPSRWTGAWLRAARSRSCPACRRSARRPPLWPGSSRCRG